jgi:hypothetical protein
MKLSPVNDTMNCREAKQYFDAYLDGELSPTLSTELGAHRVRCADCRRELALLEVSGHIIASDRDAEILDDAFTDRLLACMDRGSASSRWQRMRRYVYWAGPLAAAAVIVLVLIGTMRDSGSKVAGKKVILDTSQTVQHNLLDDEIPFGTDAPKIALDPRAREVEKFLRGVNEQVAAKKQAGEDVQRFLDLTILQILDLVKRNQTETASQPDSDDALDAPETIYDDVEENGEPVEDL